MSMQGCNYSGSVLLLLLWTGVISAQELASGDPPVEVVGGVSLPALPASAATASVEADAAAKAGLAESASHEPAQTEGSNVAIEVRPGATELVRIARNYLNRLVTPFADPKLLTVNQVEVRKEGSSIYLTTSSERPVGVHILPNDPDDTRSISLTLIPARIPPRTIQLAWSGTSMSSAPGPASSSRAKRWEQASPFEEKLLELAEIAARGEVPEGYSLTDTEDGITCSLPGVKFVPGQRLTGSKFSLYVLRATNVGKAAIELLGHAGCGVPGVALVAPWPDAYLDPGASTEVFVAVVNETYEPQPRGQTRRSLLEH